MKSRKVSAVLLGLMLLSVDAAVAAQLPRTSPDFSIKSPGGTSTQLSAFKGKVVIIEFLFVKSQHCLRVARTLNNLQSEFGSRGFQSIAIAFDAPNPASTGGDMLGSMIDYLQLTYPVGYSTRNDVDRFLDRGSEILSIPQVVVIDRNGTIRAVTGGGPNPSLEDVNVLRRLVDSLLKEPQPSSGKPKS